MSYTVRIDADVCISTGNCIRRRPEAFAFDEDDVSVPQPGAAALSLAELVEVARSCPVGAIRVFGENSAEIDPYAKGSG